MQTNYDVLIVGGGLAGNCLGLALKDSGLNIGIIEAQTRQQLYNSPAGDRALALASGTVTLRGRERALVREDLIQDDDLHVDAQVDILGNAKVRVTCSVGFLDIG